TGNSLGSQPLINTDIKLTSVVAAEGYIWQGTRLLSGTLTYIPAPVGEKESTFSVPDTNERTLFIYFNKCSDNRLMYDAEEMYFYFEDGEFPQSEANQPIEGRPTTTTSASGLTIGYDDGVWTFNGTYTTGTVVLFTSNTMSYRANTSVIMDVEYLGGTVTGEGRVIFGWNMYTSDGTKYLNSYTEPVIQASSTSLAIESAKASQDNVYFTYFLWRNTEYTATKTFTDAKFRVTLKYDVEDALNTNLSSNDQTASLTYHDTKSNVELPIYEYDSDADGEVERYVKVETDFKNNQVIEFDGKEFIALDQKYKYTDKFTINLWAYMDNWADFASSSMRLLSCTEAGGWNFEPGGGSVRFAVYAGGTYRYAQLATQLTAMTSGWHMFTVTFDGKNAKIYLDGTLEGTSDTFSANVYYHASNSIFVGAEAEASATVPIDGHYFKGKMKSVNIWHEVYSASQIAGLKQTSGVSTELSCVRQSKWFKVEPIRWRVSEYGVGAGDYPAEWNELGEYNTNFTVVSDKVLYASSMAAENSKWQEGYSNAAFHVFGNVKNYSQNYANLKYAATTNVTFDNFSVAGSQQIHGTYQSAYSGMRPVRDDDMKFNDLRAKATDFAAFMLGEESGEYVDYWTGNLGEGLGEGLIVTDYGSYKSRWLDRMYGVRFSYTMTEGSNLGGTQMRYLKLYSNGGSTNAGNYLQIIELQDGLGNVLSDINVQQEKNLDYIVSGRNSTSISSAGSEHAYVSTTQNVFIDFQEVYNVGMIRLRRYYGDARHFYGQKIEASVDGENWFNVYNSYNEGSYGDDQTINTYTETADGHMFEMPTDLLDMDDFARYINALEYKYDRNETITTRYDTMDKDSSGGYTWSGQSSGTYTRADSFTYHEGYMPDLKHGIYRLSYTAVTQRTEDFNTTTGISPRGGSMDAGMDAHKGKTFYSCLFTISDSFTGFGLTYNYGTATRFSNIKLEYLGETGKTGVNARYIRVSANGSNINESNHLTLFEVKDGKGNRIKQISASSGTGLESVISGISDTNIYDTTNCPYWETGPSFVVDLGLVYNVNTIRLRRYWKDNRYYYGSKIEYSVDGVNWKNFWNSYNEGSYGDDQTINTYVEVSGGEYFFAPNETFDMDDMMRYMNAEDYRWDKSTSTFVTKDGDSYTWGGTSGYSGTKNTDTGNGHHLYEFYLKPGKWKVSYNATTGRTQDGNPTTGLEPKKFDSSAVGGYKTYIWSGNISCTSTEWSFTFDVDENFAGFGLGYQYGTRSTFSNIRLEYLG
ncbi:MAG: LamG domain-containing protein, partial [Clostridia bacterium]|nr:LamG domain-containing protein [Clostridia bacterium]